MCCGFSFLVHVIFGHSIPYAGTGISLSCEGDRHQSCDHDDVPVHDGKDVLQGERRRQDELDFGFQFADFGADFEEPQADGVELCGCEAGAFERLSPECVEDDIGGAVEHEADTVCGEAVTGGSAAFECVFMVFDKVFHSSPVAISCFIDKRRLGAVETGDDEAAIVAQ